MNLELPGPATRSGWLCWNADFTTRGNLHGRPHLSYVLLEYVQYVPQTFAVWYEFIIVRWYCVVRNKQCNCSVIILSSYIIYR